jgi:glycosyltransferase involved in cell wall biosynthesis
MRILYYLNVSTAPEFVESDSGFHVMKQLIENVNKKRNDIYWYIIAPKQCEKLLNKERVKVLPYNFSSWAVTNRFHFDYLHFRKIFTNDYDIDLIFNSQPELTANLYSIFNLPGRDERFKIPIINYIHWLGVPETGKYQKTVFMKQLEAILLGEYTGVNSKWAKKIFIENCYKNKKDELLRLLLTDEAIKTVNEKLSPLYLGSPLEEIDKYKKLEADELAETSSERKMLKQIFETVESTKVIVFNHRLMEYTGANLFVQYINKLSAKRKDFLVWLTDPNYKAFFENEKIEMIPNLLRIKTLPWKTYIALLSRCTFSTACHPSYSCWSLSCVDTMSVSRPVLVPRAFAFPEIVGEDYQMFFGNNIEERETLWIHRAEYLLDNEDEARKIGNYCRQRVEKLFDWRKIVDTYISLFDKYVDYSYGEETESMKQLAEFVRKTGCISKREIFDYMKWSFDLNSKVTWKRYRNYLLNNGFEEDLSSPIVHFRHKQLGQRPLHEFKEELIQFDFADEEITFEFSD